MSFRLRWFPITVYTDRTIRLHLLRPLRRGGVVPPVTTLDTQPALRAGLGAALGDLVPNYEGRRFRIDEIPIVDAEGRPLGLIDVQDLVALKVIEG